MRGLSLTQPWATLVAIGAKAIETRGWPTRYRGPLLIQAAKKLPLDAQQLVYAEPFATALRDGAGIAMAAELPRGAVIAVAELYACRQTEPLEQELLALVESNNNERGERAARELSFGDYSHGRYGFLLREVRPLRQPVPCRGMLGLWDVPSELLAAVQEQVEEPAHA